MEKSSFFNSVDGDRRYKADDWAAYFASFIGNGVFPLPSTGLQVVQNSGMNISVKKGKAWINGYFYINDIDLTLSLPIADGVLNRINRIVVRWDLTERSISLKVKPSPLSSVPVAPLLQRDADAYELCLADVYVNKGVIVISQANITDQRLNNNLCGMVAGVVQQIDTTAFNAQLQAWFKDYQTMSQNDYNKLVSHFNEHQNRSDVEFNVLQDLFNKLKSDSEKKAQEFKDRSEFDYNKLVSHFNEQQNKSDLEFTVLQALFNKLKSNSESKALEFAAWVDLFKKTNEIDYFNWINSFKSTVLLNFNSWFTSFRDTNSSVFNNWYNDFVRNNEANFNKWFRDLKNTLDDNQASNLYGKIDNHEQKSILNSAEGVHGLRLYDGVLQVHISSFGWFTLMKFPKGFTAERFDEQRYTAQSFNLMQFTASKFNSLLSPIGFKAKQFDEQDYTAETFDFSKFFAGDFNNIMGVKL